MAIGVLSAAEEARLARRIEAGDSSARDEMIAQNLPLVRSIAGAYAGRGVAFDDLVQEGTVGLVRAVDKFDRRRRLKFSTYAVWWIRRSLMDAVANGPAIRVPPSARRQMAAIHRAEEELRGDAVTDEAIAWRAGLSVRSVRALRAVAHVSASLDEPLAGDGTPLGELIADPREAHAERRLELLETRRRVWSLLRLLPARHREVLLRRYGFHGARVQTHAEIAVRLEVSEERSRQLERQALHWLRELAAGGRNAA